MALDEVLDDLCVRFLVNVPADETADPNRICFTVEQAHWHYLDFCRVEDPTLPKYSMRDFFGLILKHYPPFTKFAKRADEIMTNWKKYKAAVPVFGAVMLNPQCDKLVMVKSYGKNGVWGFPKGKVNEKEAPLDCAIREVEEETGFNFRPHANEHQYIDLGPADGIRQQCRLYIVVGVPEDAHFEILTRCEIEEIKWWPRKHVPKKRSNNVDPFLSRVHAWVKTKKGKAARKAAMAKAGIDASAPSPAPSPHPSPPNSFGGEPQAPGGGATLKSLFGGLINMAVPADGTLQPPSIGGGEAAAAAAAEDSLHSLLKVLQAQSRSAGAAPPTAHGGDGGDGGLPLGVARRPSQAPGQGGARSAESPSDGQLSEWGKRVVTAPMPPRLKPAAHTPPEIAKQSNGAGQTFLAFSLDRSRIADCFRFNPV